MFYTRSRSELGSLFSECLRSFGERYLDPFFFLQGHCSIFLLCCHFWRKKSTRDFQLYVDVSPENGTYFSSILRPKLTLNFEETGVCRHFSKNDALNKWKATLDASPEMAGGTSRKAGPIRPFLGSNTPAKVWKPLFSVFKTGLP